MAPRPLVVVSEPLPEAWLAPLRAHAQVHVGLDIDAAGAAQVEGLLCMLTVPVDGGLLARFPALRVVANMAVGHDNVDLPACARRHVRVSNTPGVLTDATADLAMGLVLAAARNFECGRRDASEGRWGPWSPTGWLGLELRGATLGIVGLGAIGSAVARRARAFGMHIAYCGPRPKPALAEEFDASFMAFDELVEHADLLSLHCPLTPQTRALMCADVFARMQNHARLINSSRGAVVNTDDLVAALRDGQIAGAALDVTDPEPLPATHALYQLPNCLIVPHLGSATHATRARMASLAIENLLAGLQGAAMPNLLKA